MVVMALAAAVMVVFVLLLAVQLTLVSVAVPITEFKVTQAVLVTVIAVEYWGGGGGFPRLVLTPLWYTWHRWWRY